MRRQGLPPLLRARKRRSSLLRLHSKRKIVVVLVVVYIVVVTLSTQAALYQEKYGDVAACYFLVRKTVTRTKRIRSFTTRFATGLRKSIRLERLLARIARVTGRYICPSLSPSLHVSSFVLFFPQRFSHHLRIKRFSPT